MRRRTIISAALGIVPLGLVRISLVPMSLLPLVLALVTGCGGAPSREEQPLPEYPGTLVDTSDMGADFLSRQRVTFLRGETESSMTAVVQKKGDELVLLALTPFGSRAFMIRQQGTEFEVQSFVPQPFPVPPRFVLLDVHRVNFMRLGTPKKNGEIAEQRGDERIVERWESGRLIERRFYRNDYPEPIVIRYQKRASQAQEEGGDDAEAQPDESASRGQIQLENGWLHYRLNIEILEQTNLGASASVQPETTLLEP